MNTQKFQQKYGDFLRLSNIKTRTLWQNKVAVEQFICYTEDTHRVTDTKQITVEMVADWVADMAKRGLKARTINAYIARVSHAFGIMQVIEGERVNPVAQYGTVSNKRKPEKRQRWVSWDQALAMMQWCEANDNEMYKVCLLGFYCGMRMSEILAARYRDLSKFKIVVHGAKGGGDVEVGLVPAVWLVLAKEAEKEHPDHFIVGPDHFGNPYNTDLPRWDFSQRFKRAAAAAGLPAWVSPHTMRHTCATRMIEKGHSLEQVARHLRHASIKTTQQYADIGRITVVPDLG